jgi:poly(3-hydroxybutyrate) depolymerase
MSLYRRLSCLPILLVALSAACSDSNEIRGTDSGPSDGGTDSGSAQTADGGDPCALGETCDGVTGLCESSPLCSQSNPCEDALVGLERRTVTEPLTVPVCRTTRAGRPMFDDGPPRTWESDGITRAACVYSPRTATSSTPRPLVVYLHGAGGNAAAIYDSTSLRSKARTFDLAGDGIRGFVLAAHQGRNQENENGNPPASRHDVYYRAFEGAVNNADARSLDTMVDDLVATGTVDPTRIYVTGWSNGAFFGQAYALFRRRTPTPGGHRVAAVVAFDGADPFQTPRRDLLGCELDAPPSVPLPVMLIHRACSIVGCDAAQNTALDLPPGFDVTTWAARLEEEIGATVVNRVIERDGTVGACDAVCSSTIATLQHLYWPDGIADRSGIDHEPEMLSFLRDHPL